MLVDRNKRNAVQLLNNPVSSLTGRMPKEGMLYGLELELEGRGVQMEGIASKNWKRAEEGSLRGESVEYVFAAPCEYKEAVARVNKLFEMFNKNGVKLKNSYRTSTHVHVNFSDKPGKQVINFFLLYTILEEVLEYYCGEMRKGNLFCLSCRDNEQLIDFLSESIFDYGNYGTFSNEVRYNAANLAALNKFGTIELRTMRGADRPEDVLDWLEVVHHLYEFSCSDKCPKPWELVESLSHLGLNGFLTQVFPQRIVDKLLKAWPPVKDVRYSLLTGVRLIQMLAYKLEGAWNEPFEDKLPAFKKAKVNKPKRLLHERNNAQNNQIMLEDGRRWFVKLDYEHGEILEDNDDYRWDSIGHYFRNIHSDHRCRWLLHTGEPVVEGDGWNWWLEENEDEDEDHDPEDWG